MVVRLHEAQGSSARGERVGCGAEGALLATLAKFGADCPAVATAVEGAPRRGPQDPGPKVLRRKAGGLPSGGCRSGAAGFPGCLHTIFAGSVDPKRLRNKDRQE